MSFIIIADEGPLLVKPGITPVGNRDREAGDDKTFCGTLTDAVEIVEPGVVDVLGSPEAVAVEVAESDEGEGSDDRLDSPLPRLATVGPLRLFPPTGPPTEPLLLLAPIDPIV